MILESHQHNEGVTFNFEPFKFDGCPGKSSRFLIDFVCEDVEYEYAFELTRERIISESLYYYPVGRRAKVFVRTADGKYSFGTGAITKPMDVVLNTSDKTLFLSRASSMKRPLAQTLYRYFMNQFLLGLVNVNDLMVLDSFNTYKQVILKALEICDTDITDIEVRKEQMPAPVLPGCGTNGIVVQACGCSPFQDCSSQPRRCDVRYGYGGVQRNTETLPDTHPAVGCCEEQEKYHDG